MTYVLFKLTTTSFYYLLSKQKTKMLLLLPIALFTLTACQSFSRKLQSASFGGYCPECLVNNIDEDIAELNNLIKLPKSISMNQVIIFDKEGKPVCTVDLRKHPDLVPNFGKLNKKEIVQNKTNTNRQPASLEEFKLPPCSKEYLAQLKKVTKSNATINGKKSHIHKTGGLKAATVGISCLVGVGAGAGLSVALADAGFSAALENKIEEEDGSKARKRVMGAAVGSFGLGAVATHSATTAKKAAAEFESASKIKTRNAIQNKMLRYKLMITPAALCSIPGFLGGLAALYSIFGE